MGKGNNDCLTENITNWKIEFSKNPNMTADNIDELESHLWDETESLQKLGLNAEEAFLIAKQRIGSIDKLTSEYSKVNDKIAFRNKLIPYLNGVLLYIAIINIAEVFTNASMLGLNKIGMTESYTNWISIILLSLLSISMFVVLYKKYSKGSFHIGKLRNIPILSTVIVLSKTLLMFTKLGLYHSAGISSFASVQMNLSVYKLIFLLVVLAISCLVYYASKKEKKLSIAD